MDLIAQYFAIFLAFSSHYINISLIQIMKKEVNILVDFCSQYLVFITQNLMFKALHILITLLM